MAVATKSRADKAPAKAEHPASVLIVEDSAVVREYLVAIFQASPQFRVMGTAVNGVEALRFLESARPDVIVMDLRMPVMDGIEATRRIMSTNPIPIVILSASLNRDEVNQGFNAMAAGALAAFPKPPGIGHPDQPRVVRQLLATVRALAEVRLVRRHGDTTGSGTGVTAEPAAARTRNQRLVAIGVSTGGPPVVQQILSALPRDFPFPILLVQHICAGFVQGFVDWLNQTSALTVRVAVAGEPLMPGIVYVAPDGAHLTVSPTERVVLVPPAPEDIQFPSVARLFRSVTEVFGANAVGVLLTGMGEDGAAELKKMRERNGITIIQNEATAAVFGMPGAALKLDAPMHILSPSAIAAFLCDLAVKRRVRSQIPRTDHDA